MEKLHANTRTGLAVLSYKNDFSHFKS
jgi:hypothetical protein